MFRKWLQIVLCAVLVVCIMSPVLAAGPRRVISLDGMWEIAQGDIDTVPAEFTHKVPVPGLVDMAEPAFKDVGKKSDLREAFWYRKQFKINGDVPATAKLRIGKAKYGTKVYLNGKVAGEDLSCFTASVFDVKEYLKGKGAENELVVRVGAWRESVPRSVPSGWDVEKLLYIPGIYDKVELILTGAVYVENVQTVPQIGAKSVRVVAEIVNVGDATKTSPTCVVHEATARKIVGTEGKKEITIGKGELKKIEFDVSIDNCRLWSPEDPFLYEADVTVDGDTIHTRFGMRQFKFENKQPVLNGKVYPMLGTNVCIYRFFEDPVRGELPWDKEWVRKLHRKFKGFGWNSIRYCIGFPPEVWYEVADEEGMLIADEYPLWQLKGVRADGLVPEFTEWMRERWNHACVVIWDAQNETDTEHTGRVIKKVRRLDLSHRPWDNGWDVDRQTSDIYEIHTYPVMHLREKGFELADLPRTYPEKLEIGTMIAGNPHPNKANSAVILNEYGWMWLNRDGTPTTLSKEVFYEKIVGKKTTTEQRRYAYARYLAAMTEFYRGMGRLAGLLHFCGLGYSREGGHTSDNFIDVRNLIFEPNFEKYVGDAFSPVGLMIDEWEKIMESGEKRIDVVVINDMQKDWKGPVSLKVMQDGKEVTSATRNVEVSRTSRQRVGFEISIPEKKGKYQLVAELATPAGKKIQSLRSFKIVVK